VGEPVQQMRFALREIERLGLGRVLKRSHLYRTEPVGVKDQDWFVNAVALIETELTPLELMQGLLKLEEAAGRNRNQEIKNGPRPLDLDILFIEDQVLDEGGLIVPHPRAHLRRFVMEPLADLDPLLLHPTLGLTAQEIIESLKDQAAVERLDLVL
jgi:2-amino-4-hydroxy-6-hydroxymethyldihydropteridine diphosphokinase